METQVLQTPADYAAALKVLDSLMAAERGTTDGQRLLALAKLIEEYESKHFPMIENCDQHTGKEGEC